jgi:hypothetical protein
LSHKTKATVCQWFDIKTTGTVFSVVTSKPVTTVFSGLTSKSVVMVSLGLTSKPVVGFLFGSQNQGGGGFPDLALKTDSYDLVIWVSKSLRRFLGLGFKIMQTTVCRLHHKTDGRAMA